MSKRLVDGNKHAKKDIVTDTPVAEPTTVVVRVDQSGNTLNVETNGDPTVSCTSYSRLDLPIPTTTMVTSTRTARFVGTIGTIGYNTTLPIRIPESLSTLILPIPAKTLNPAPQDSSQTGLPEASSLSTLILPISAKTLHPAPQHSSQDELSTLILPIPVTASNSAPQHSSQTGLPEPSSSSSQDKEPNVKIPAASPKGLGICYAPYNHDGGCKTQGQVDADFGKFSGYSTVRSYGTDCNQISMMINAAKKHHKKVFIGVFELNNLDAELKSLIDAAKSSWSSVDTVSIGNELVHTGKSSAQDVVNAVNHARSTLRAAGYKGPVVTVDTADTMIKNPQLCKASDYCAVNAHAFYNSETSRDKAGEFVRSQAKLVSKAAGGKKTVVTETGWPHGGNQNGKAVPSKQNQGIALHMLKKAFAGTDGELFLFSAFDDPWKKDNPSTFGTERFWGFL